MKEINQNESQELEELIKNNIIINTCEDIWLLCSITSTMFFCISFLTFLLNILSNSRGIILSLGIIFLIITLAVASFEGIYEKNLRKKFLKK
jgi:hypothetical protein